MCVNKAFTPQAEISILNNDSNQFVSKSIYETKIKVTEYGTKAAAVAFFNGIKWISAKWTENRKSRIYKTFYVYDMG